MELHHRDHGICSVVNAKLETLRKDDENADADVDQRKPRTTHMQYGQPRFHHVLPRWPKRENPTFAVLWKISVYLHFFSLGNGTVSAFLTIF